MLGRSSEGMMPRGVLWCSRPCEKTQALSQPSGTEFTMKIFCLKLAFEHVLLTHHLPEIAFFPKVF